MSNNQQKLREKYEHEIREINYILKNLEEGRIYGLGSNVDRSAGSLQTNISKLRERLNDLFYKVENNKPSDSETLQEAFNKFID
ncbi:hypothetical protein [Lysinibacillus antri]|uniref:Uncharacterized protein n=1 Tax=Lysinibacillus antri TaxID=2498145 RepID=A0A432LAN8_9BACI|nr:hypothetical protein [Lysinibacillus antri]RUL51119.1 hypothetical protein EK386_12995 [Lysinibacillus antri]